jgi:hypothetical protein
MVTLAALVLGATLTTTAADAPAVEQAPDPPTPRQLRAERHRRRMATIHTVGGVALEVGAGFLHLMTASGFIGHDLSCTGEACHLGTPVVLFLPAGAVAMGWIGATRLAAGREASIWRSPLFWAGTATTIFGTLAAMEVTGAIAGSGETRGKRVAVDTAFVAGLVLGNVLEVWGAFTAPPREPPAGTRPLSVAPACGPTTGGVVCGLALAGF